MQGSPTWVVVEDIQGSASVLWLSPLPAYQPNCFTSHLATKLSLEYTLFQTAVNSCMDRLVYYGAPLSHIPAPPIFYCQSHVSFDLLLSGGTGVCLSFQGVFHFKWSFTYYSQTKRHV